MDLAELSHRTGLERRRLRYTLDHQLVPRLRFKIVDDEVGRPRHFAEDVGFAIVCATLLLDVGLRHEVIRHYLQGLLDITVKQWGPEPALNVILQGRFAAQAELGDQARVRVWGEDFDSGWMLPGHPRRSRQDFEPTSVIGLNIGSIRDRVFATHT